MERSTLSAALKRVEPALSSKDLIPVLACFCFGEASLHAYDDVVALVLPYSTNFNPGIRGGVKGGILKAMLDSSKAKDVVFDQTGTSINLKLGRTKCDLPLLPINDFLFQEPKLSKADAVVLDPRLLAGITKASVGMGSDPSNPWLMGVASGFGSDGKSAVFYSTDNKTATRVRVGKPDIGGPTVVLPPRFVELLMSSSKNDPPGRLYLTRDYAAVQFASGLLLLSKVMSTANFKLYEQLFSSVDAVNNPGVEVPKGLDRALDRALVVLPFAKEPHATLSVGADRIRLTTESSAGNVADWVPFAGKHEEVKVVITPDLLVRALPHAERLLLTQDWVRFSGKGLTHIVSTVKE